ncbi:hypothetical protein SAMN05421756_102570 [Microlunatus flavus]|uniref:Uncharacterized protein n=1 Tax=Microlunatus flavus TaxID=1036181 RepID=A0A1H9DK35_9ACTN|nr:hypothetical protein SAMN05421756_102570 [Microlunatus flavus]
MAPRLVGAPGAGDCGVGALRVDGAVLAAGAAGASAAGAAGAAAAGACTAGSAGVRVAGADGPGVRVDGADGPGVRVDGAEGAGALRVDGADGPGVRVDGADGAGALRVDGAELDRLGSGRPGTPGRGAPGASVVLLGAGAVRAAGAAVCAPSADGPSFSRRRRITGASRVDEGDLTNSPMSLAIVRTALLSTPSSFASS